MRISKFIFILVFISLLFCAGCGKKERAKEDKNNENKSSESVDDVETWAKNNIADKYYLIDEIKMDIPFSYKNLTIDWASSDFETIDDEGNLVYRSTKGITEVEFTYKFLSGDEVIYTGKTTAYIYPKTFDAVYNVVSSLIPDEIGEDLAIIEPTYFKLYNVNWESTDTSLVTNEGKYIKPELDSTCTFKIKISIDESHFKEYEKEAKVLSITPIECVLKTLAWIQDSVLAERDLTSDLVLPTIEPDTLTTITWKTSNPDLISLDGKVRRSIFTRYVQLDAHIQNGASFKDTYFFMKIEPLDISSYTEVELLDAFVKEIAVESLSRLTWITYTNITQTYNSLFLFDNVWEEEIDAIVPLTVKNCRPGTKTTIRYICVHDTASTGVGGTAKAHADLVNNGYGGATTSFHYCVGNDGIYHIIPNDEVAYHAGDGTRYSYKLYDTGVKALTKMPNIAISSDGYFTFNGVKSKIHVPSGANANSNICQAGLLFEVGENGNYWLNENYFNDTYNYISNRGGNNNSIGIETCVNNGTDYLKTLRINADLVARLLTELNLTTDDVWQHNNFSGKPCPMAMRDKGYWQNFKDLVSLEYFGMNHFKGLTFEWHSASSIMDDNGYIAKAIGKETSVKYSLVVKRGEEVIYNKEFTTLLK